MKRLLLFLGVLISLGAAQAQNACRTPISFGAIPLTGGTAAGIIWAGTGATKYELQYKAGASTTYTSVIISTSGGAIDSGYYRLTGLTACTPYAYRLRSICAVRDTSAWSRIGEFKTAGCPEPCTAPRGVFAVATDSTAVLGWSATSNGTYIVLWKRANDTSFQTATANTNSLVIRGLQPCSNYQFKVQTVCSGSASSSFSEIKTFKTGGCSSPCTTPREVRAVAQGTSVIVGWVGILPATYQIQYRVGTDTTWRAATSTALVYTLNNATACTKYTFRVRLVCSTIATSEWSSSVSVTSAGCVSTECHAPRSLSATGAATSATLKWDTARGVAGRTYDIQYLTIGDTAWRTISRVSGNVYNLTGLTSCKIYAFRVRTNCSATASSVWSAPMRFETNGCPPVCKTPVALRVVTNDTVAVVTWSGTATSYKVSIIGVDSVGFPRRTTTVTGNSTTLTGLARCKSYIISVSALCDGNRESAANRTAFETRCATNCTPAVVLGSEIVSDTVALLKFNRAAVQGFVIQYRVAGTTAWTSIQLNSVTTDALPYRLTGLARCTQYEWRVIRNCGSVGTAESRIETFKTKGCLSCPAVTQMNATSNRGDSTIVEGSTVAGAARYVLLVQLRGAARVDTFASATPRFVLRGLTLCQNYQLTLFVICSNGARSEGKSITHKPGSNCLWDEDPEGFLAAQPTSVFAVSPNPGREVVQVAYQLEQSADVTIQMMNLQGQLMSQVNAGNQDAGKYVQTLDGLGNLQNGLYFVVLRSNGKVLQTLKWQKQ